MRNILLITLISFLFFQAGYSQSNFNNNFKIGINGGIPVGGIENDYDYQIGADIAYLATIVGLFEAGPVVGYSHFLGTDEFDDRRFVPIAGAFRFGLPQNIFLGGHLGYALGANSETDGGFYYRPQLGMDFGRFDAILSFMGIDSNGSSFSTVTAGIELSF